MKDTTKRAPQFFISSHKKGVSVETRVATAVGNLGNAVFSPPPFPASSRAPSKGVNERGIPNLPTCKEELRVVSSSHPW